LHASVRFGVAGPGPGAELSLLQDFIRILEVPLRKRVAAAELEATKLEVAQAVIDLAGNVKTAFYTLQGAEQTLELRRTVAHATDLQALFVGPAPAAGLVPDGLCVGEAARWAEGEWSAGPAIESSTPICDQGQAAVAKAVAELRERQRRYAALAIHIRSQVRR